MSLRSTYFIGFLLAASLFALSMYVQLIDGIMPCPLCVFQRATVGILGVIFLFGIISFKFKYLRYFVHTLLILLSLAGASLACRQIWLQHFPPANNDCGVSLQYMLQTFPLNEVLQKIIFEGTAECTARGWEFLSLNMAEWSLLWFVVFLGLSINLLIKDFKYNRSHLIRL